MHQHGFFSCYDFLMIIRKVTLMFFHFCPDAAIGAGYDAKVEQKV